MRSTPRWLAQTQTLGDDRLRTHIGFARDLQTRSACASLARDRARSHR
jgi:hypothetical protein